MAEKKVILRCPTCKVMIDITEYPPGMKFMCRNCQSTLAVPKNKQNSSNKLPNANSATIKTSVRRRPTSLGKSRVNTSGVSKSKRAESGRNSDSHNMRRNQDRHSSTNEKNKLPLIIGTSVCALVIVVIVVMAITMNSNGQQQANTNNLSNKQKNEKTNIVKKTEKEKPKEEKPKEDPYYYGYDLACVQDSKDIDLLYNNKVNPEGLDIDESKTFSMNEMQDEINRYNAKYAPKPKPAPNYPPPANPQPVNPPSANPQPVNPQPVNPPSANPQPVNPQPINPPPANPQPVANPNASPLEQNILSILTNPPSASCTPEQKNNRAAQILQTYGMNAIPVLLKFIGAEDGDLAEESKNIILTSMPMFAKRLGPVNANMPLEQRKKISKEALESWEKHSKMFK